MAGRRTSGPHGGPSHRARALARQARARIAAMELRQLRYFVRVAELGSMGRAAADLGLVTSALSQQISRLEGELSTRLLVRSAAGVTPTNAGLAFLRQAQLALRHADDAVRAAQQERLSGHVSVGLAPTTGAVLGLPLMLPTGPHGLRSTLDAACASSRILKTPSAARCCWGRHAAPPPHRVLSLCAGRRPATLGDPPCPPLAACAAAS